MELKLSNSKQIRTRLLLNLGVTACLRNITSCTPTCENTSSGTTRSTLVGTGAPFVEPLKYNRFYDDDTVSCSPSSLPDIATTGTASPLQCRILKKHRKAKSALSFNDLVHVFPIPHHEAYSDRLRSRMWNDSYEIMFNVRRNTIEFAAEGWDWRNVVEDDMLHSCPETGERVHPVHILPERPRLTRGSSVMVVNT